MSKLAVCYRRSEATYIWHNKRSTLSFADGHAELMTWVHEETLRFTNPSNRSVEAPSLAKDNPDLMLLTRGYGGIRVN